MDASCSSAWSVFPSAANAPAPSSFRVVLPMAETTITGPSGKCVWMILITRSMDAASLTELPPNFMTIIDAPKRKSSENPNLHNYTPKSRTSRQVHIEKEWRPSRAEVDLYCKEEPAV